MTNEDKRMIPLAAVDALIAKFEEHDGTLWSEKDIVDILKMIKKEAISVFVQREGLEQSFVCPFCKESPFIVEGDNLALHIYNKHKLTKWTVAVTIQDLVSKGNKTTEQRIRDRIKELEKQLEECDGYTSTKNMVGMIISELRKLVPK